MRIMNYIGSKLSLLSFLTDTITEVTGIEKGDGHTFADLFAGTGVVASHFRENGWSVTTNDIQYYSYVLNRHYAVNTSDMRPDFAQALNALEGIEGFVYNNYCAGSGSGRQYYTDENGKKCDAVRTEIERLYQSGEITENEYYWYLASLIVSIDKYANTAAVYGAFLKHYKRTAAQAFEFELLPVNRGREVGRVFNTDINKLILREDIKGDVLYLDPPYNQRQYCTNYHVLETIARYDDPVLHGKTGLREYGDQKSLYCSKDSVAAVFEELVKNARFKYVFLSYNNEGLMSIDTVREIMERYGEYKLYKKEDYHRFRADKEGSRNHKSDTTTEYLHCLIKDG